MEQTVNSLILLPRFTSIVGVGTFLLAPFNVRLYGSAFFLFTKVAGLGLTQPSVTVYVQESPDLEIWEDIDTALVHDVSMQRPFQFEWIRLKLVVTGSDPGFTCWCVGDFIRREA